MRFWQRLDAAWRKGWIAASQGARASANPYKPRSRSGQCSLWNHEWQNGWAAYHNGEPGPDYPNDAAGRRLAENASGNG